MLRYLCVAVCFLQISSATAGGIKCIKQDASFAEFLDRFTENILFQRSRIVLPLVAKFGDYRLVEPIIKIWTLKDISSLPYPLIYSKMQRKKGKLVQTILLNTERYFEVYQEYGGEGDSPRILYKFRNISGCWYLEEIHDKSL